MKAVRRRDTACELELRSEVHQRGLRYRVDWPLPGTRRRADMAFPKARVAVFVDGCFWHGCPNHKTVPRSNRKWWQAKLRANMARDLDTNRKLIRQGWKVLRFWEHEDMSRAMLEVLRAVRSSTRQT